MFELKEIPKSLDAPKIMVGDKFFKVDKDKYEFIMEFLKNCAKGETV